MSAALSCHLIKAGRSLEWGCCAGFEAFWSGYYFLKRRDFLEEAEFEGGVSTFEFDDKHL